MKNLECFVEFYIRSGNSELLVKNKELWNELKQFVHNEYNQQSSVLFSTDTDSGKKVNGMKLFGINFIYIEQ